MLYQVLYLVELPEASCTFVPALSNNYTHFNKTLQRMLQIKRDRERDLSVSDG